MTFRITFRSDDDWIEIELVDSGDPAPPEAFERRAPAAPSDVDSVQPGGLGVHLMQKVMDEVSYTKNGWGGTSLTMRKRLVRPGEGPRKDRSGR